MCATAALADETCAVRYSDRAAQLWVARCAPCAWRGRVELEFGEAPLTELQPAGSLIDPARVRYWLKMIETGRAIPSLSACRTEHNQFYVFDGNHRYLALRQLFQHGNPPVHIGLLQPRAGYEFRYRWFQTYGTYVLEPASVSQNGMDANTCFAGRTLVLLAHPDDETGCAGLLQRFAQSVAVYATDGAPRDRYFWAAHRSQREYARQRRREAAAALALAGAWKLEFLSDYDSGLVDQELHKALAGALAALRNIVRRYCPAQILVPAYEGGHPDHDACSFLGYLAHKEFGLPVWEVPLYHRAESGQMVTQRFRQRTGTERMLHLSPGERKVRSHMMDTYASQADLAEFVTSQVEFYRPQVVYDYSQPPHSGRLNYEVWQWPISPMEICSSFKECLGSGPGLPVALQPTPLLRPAPASLS